jgi:drug/metabolite transporter (DMT)-like permease
MIHLLALAGVFSISFSAVFVRLAAVSPATASFFRAAYAIPMLALLWSFQRHRDRRPPRDRLLALTSGVILGFELTVWHESIALIGVGLATVLANVQVVFVAVVARLLYGERLDARKALIIAGVLGGVALTSGLARHDAYGSAPVLGVVLGAFAGACYSAFLLMFRAANRSLGPTSGPLLDATIGTAIGALACATFDPRFALALHWPAHLWLVLLALVAQVVGWLLIATALPRLPATETSIVLLVQPVFALVWGLLIFAEHLSPLQWTGAAMVMAGVATISAQKRPER